MPAGEETAGMPGQGASGDPYDRLARAEERAKAGGAERYHLAAAQQGKLFARERIRRLVDPGSEWIEDGLLAAAEAGDLPADAVVTGIGRLLGRPVAIVASDGTVKAGSWGARTVEKMVRMQETALRLQVPIVYLVDSAGARITDQVAMFPGRRHAGRIFYNQVKMSGVVPQVCVLLGPSPAGAAYLPALSDVTIMVDRHASAFLGSPRMAEMVIGEHVSLEEMGGARMHCKESGLGDLLAADEDEAMALVRRYLSYMPQGWRERPPAADPRPPAASRPAREIVPDRPNAPFDMLELIRALVDDGSFFELKPLYAPEILCGFARLDGQAVGIVANQPKVKGGVLFVDSSDKAARFIWLCNAYRLPLVYLADVPGFMIGSRVERQGIIRHGAKMICATSEATVPKICVIVRKCYGAGLYAMAGPAFEPECTLALPTAQIAVMGPEAAVNAVYYNRITELPEAEREPFVAQKRAEYVAGVDVVRLASELVVDAVVAPERLRDELVNRLRAYVGRPDRAFGERRNPVYPV